jgi:hypothetical protein
MGGVGSVEPGDGWEVLSFVKPSVDDAPKEKEKKL